MIEHEYGNGFVPDEHCLEVFVLSPLPLFKNLFVHSLVLYCTVLYCTVLYCTCYVIMKMTRACLVAHVDFFMMHALLD